MCASLVAVTTVGFGQAEDGQCGFLVGPERGPFEAIGLDIAPRIATVAAELPSGHDVAVRVLTCP
jgi:hypothetical protein